MQEREGSYGATDLLVHETQGPDLHDHQRGCLIMELPIYKGRQLPQIWIEGEAFIVESPSFRYVIQLENNRVGDPVKLLFKLCRRMKTEAIKSTYCSV